jgi:ABC-type bacteriocin/lantibiotic exporter with double-glycine peptidase domain
MNINLQHDWKDCGLYCLESFYEYYYQDQLDISQLKSITTYGNRGINILELNQTANKIGLKIESYKLDKIELMAYKNKKPFIALINNDGYSHYIIIYKKNKSTYFILDPAKGRYKLSIQAFNNIFTGIILLVEKSNKKGRKSPNNSLFQYFIKEKKSIFFLIILLIIISVSSILSSYFLKFVVDKVIPSQANKLLNVLFIFFS